MAGMLWSVQGIGLSCQREGMLEELGTPSPWFNLLPRSPVAIGR